MTVCKVIDHSQRGGVYNCGRFCLYACLSVCQMITFESLDVGSSYLHKQYISRQYGSSLYVKVMPLVRRHSCFEMELSRRSVVGY